MSAEVHVVVARGTSKARSPALQRGEVGRQTKAAVERRKEPRNADAGICCGRIHGRDDGDTH